MKNILLTTSTLPRFEGDTEPRFVLDLAKALSTKYSVTILAPAAPNAALEEMLEGVRVIRYRYAPLRRLELLCYPGAIMPRLKQNPLYWLLVPMIFSGLFFALRRLLKDECFDCVHCHWLLPQGLIQTLGFSKAQYPPFIVTSHGGDLHSLKGNIIEYFYRHVLRKAAQISVVSTALQNDIARYMHANTNTTVMLTPMGVNSERFHPNNHVDDYFHRFSIKGPVILSVGRLAEKKGLNYLLDAMATPQLRSLSCQLVIIGDGPERALLEDKRLDLNLESRVHFLGSFNHNELPKLYASAQFFCAPSIIAENGDRDGLPTVILEASASGLACICSDVGGIGDFIQSGINGLLVPAANPTALANAIETLLNDTTYRLSMANQARKSADEYNWPLIADKFSTLYLKAIESRIPNDGDKSCASV